MILGNPRAWLPSFHDAEERIVGRIATVWQMCMKTISSSDLEDKITRTLVRRLQRDEEMRQIGYPDRKELLEDEPHLGDVRGEIDFAVPLGGEPDMFLAFECKRLNVSEGGSR